jgi:peptidyl-prolyl cis-trans isomerase SurA
MKNSIKQKIDQGQRAQLMGNSVIKRLLKEYEIYVNQEKLSSFSKPEWEKNGALQSKDILMTIEDTRIGVKDFFKYYQSNSNLSVDQAFNKFKEEKVLDYYKSKLPEKNPELKETMKEYREGLLLFDLMQKRIWDRAEKDTLGLKIFFDSHTDNYKWKERANLTIATLKHTESDTILKLLQNNVESDSIWAAFKEKDLIDIKDDVIEYSHPNFPKGLELKMGEYKIETLGNQSKLYYVRDIIPVENQTLNEVKGKAISDYQDHLEKEWVTNLKQRFVVKVNKKTFKYLKSKYNQ